MAQVYTFTDSNNEVRLRAEINPAPGGSQITTHCVMNGAYATVTASGQTNLPIDTLLDGTALLDITSPTVPTIIATGVYAFTFTITPNNGLTAGVDYEARVSLDDNGSFPIYAQLWSALAATSNNFTPTIVVSMTYSLPAGAVINVNVYNPDAGDLDFRVLRCFIQRVG